jgi:hypothetical protein
MYQQMLSALVSILVLFPLTQNVLSPNTPAQNTLAPNALGQNASTQNATVQNALAPNASVQSALDTTRLPQPVFAENPGFVELYWKAWNLAWDHVKINPDLPHPRHMDENIREDIIWIWDSEFMAMFCKYAPDIFPGVETLNNFYSAMLDGKLFVAGWGYINQDSAPSSGSSPSNAQYLYLGPYGSMSVNLGGEEYLYGIYD